MILRPLWKERPFSILTYTHCMQAKDALKLVAAVGVSQLAGLLGTIVTAPAIPGWYAALEKPALNPPSWVFGPVWTTLYVLMGIAAFLVWRKGLQEREVRIALGVFVVQLVLNALWSFVFFGMQEPGLALINIATLWLAIVITGILFWRIERAAAYLLVPYLLWVSFASYLNYAIWSLN